MGHLRHLRTGIAGTLALILAGCGAAPTAPPVATGDRPPVFEVPDTDLGNRHPEMDAELAPLLLPVREALARGDWVAASVALPVTVDGQEGSASADWLRYYALLIARQAGDLARAATLRAALSAGELTPALRAELDLLMLRDARLAGDHRTVADMAYRLLEQGGHRELPPRECEALLWDAAQAVADARGAPWASWQTLGRAASIADGARAADAISDWLAAHAEHPAAPRAQVLLNASLSDAALARPTLLLPLSGPLAAAGDALAAGITAAYFAGNPAAQEIAVLDSRRFNRIDDAYRAAIDGGADVILGPLGKRQVEELLATATGERPLLTLNRPESAVPNPGGALQLSLAPEDEAELIARRAWAAGARRALVLRPEGEWGTRMEAALQGAWAGVGGRTLARAVYSNSASYSPALQSALLLDASTARQRELRTLFTEPVQSVGQRRRDIDVIFMLARTSAEARALKPLINYHYAGDLLVYALASADDGLDDAGDRDLNGVRLPVMPWRLTALPPGIDDSDTGGSFAALHALGADAWEIALRAHRLSSGAGLRYSGHTARLAVAADGALLRELPVAEYDRGQLAAN